MLREVDFVVQDEGRDKGKTFHLTEAPAAHVEWWAIRVYAGLERAGVDVGPVVAHGAKGFIFLGLKALALLPPHELKPLMDEMYGRCVTVKPDPYNPAVVRQIIDQGGAGDDIQEALTRFKLRQAIIELHLGFSLTAAISTSAPVAQQDQPKDPPTTSSNIPTSQGRLARRFHPIKPPSTSSAQLSD